MFNCHRSSGCQVVRRADPHRTSLPVQAPVPPPQVTGLLSNVLTVDYYDLKYLFCKLYLRNSFSKILLHKYFVLVFQKQLTTNLICSIFKVICMVYN